MDITTVLAALGVLAALNERLIEYTLGRLHKPTIDAVLPGVVIAMGVAEALAFRLNVVPPEWQVPAIVGYIATGATLSLGTEGIHLLAGKAIKTA